LAGEWEEQSYQTYLNHGNNYRTLVNTFWFKEQEDVNLMQ
jgi:hypothetical protein